MVSLVSQAVPAIAVDVADLFELVRMLEEDPTSLGRLRGVRLFNDRTHEAKERLAALALRLSERADL